MNFAALLDNSSVICWGNPVGHKNPKNTGNNPPIIAGEKVMILTSNSVNFAALLDSGRVITWGHVFPKAVTTLPAYGNKRVVSITPNEKTFTIRYNDSSTATLGYIGAGGQRMKS